MITQKQLYQVVLSVVCALACWSQSHAQDTAPIPVTPVAASELNSGDGVFLTLTRGSAGSATLPTSVATVTPEDYRGFDAQNAGDAISRQTSVNIQQQGRLGTFRLAGIRGATSNQTLVLLDGRPVGGVGLSSSQDLSEIPLEQIERIEIVRGGVSALYGPNAVGGVINVISKRSTHEGVVPAVDAGFEARSFGGQITRLSAGSRLGPVDYYIFGNQQRESGFRDNSDAKTYNIGGNLGVSMGVAGKLLFDVAGYGSNAGVPGQLSPAIPVNQFDNEVEKQASTPDARQLTDSKYIRTSYILPLAANMQATVRGFGSERQVEFAIPTFLVDTDRHEQSKGLEGQLDLPLGFTAGGSFLRDKLDSRDRTTPDNNFVASVENWGVYLEENFRYKWLGLIASGRYDHHSQFGETKNPRVQVLADATEWLRFSGSAARSFRAPTLDDLYYPFTDFGFGFSFEGNPDLRPERAWTYDAGIELHKGTSGVKLTYFRSNISDLIQTTSDPAATTVNVGTARRQGFETEIHHTVASAVRHSLNYTYLENMGKPSGFTEYVVLRLSPRHTVNDLITLKLGEHLTFDNNLRYMASSYEGNDMSGAKIGDRLLWDIRAAYQIRQVELYAGVNDLTDKRYEERSGFPMPGRTYFGGVSLRFGGKSS